MVERSLANNPNQLIDLVPQAKDSITIKDDDFFGPEIPISPTRRMEVTGNRFVDFTHEHNNGLTLLNGEPNFSPAYTLDQIESLYVLGVRITGRFPLRKDLVCRIKLPKLNLTLEGSFELKDEDLEADLNSRHIAITEDWKILSTGQNVYFFVKPEPDFFREMQFSLVRKHRAGK